MFMNYWRTLKDQRYLTSDKVFKASFYLLFLSAVTLVVPNVKPYEGSQIGVPDLKMTTDWWDVAAPTLPRILNLEESPFKWHAFQILILISAAFGIRKLLPIEQVKKTSHKMLYLVFSYVFFIFSILGARDGIALSLIVLGIAAIKTASLNSRLIQYLKILLGFIVLIVASQYKITLIFIISFLIFTTFMKIWIRKSQIIALAIISFIVLPFGTLTLDYFLTNSFKLQKTYPEQQVMLYDLTGVMCWSTSNRAVDFATNALENFTKSEVSEKKLCQFLVPYGWDSIKKYPISIDRKEYLSPTKDKINFLELRNSWTVLLFKFPKDWVELKTNFAGQVFFMSNLFDNGEKFIDVNKNFQYAVYQAFLLPVKILDKMFILTYFFSFFFVLISKVLYQNIVVSKQAASILIIGVIVNLASFVADNGRYSLPFLLLFWALVLQRNVEETTNKSSYV